MPSRRSAISIDGSLGVTALAGCSTSDDLADPVSTQQERKRGIVNSYDEAVGNRNDAAEARVTGIDLFNAKKYADAIDPIETALSGYEDAEDGFAEAGDLAAEIDAGETAADLCETAVDETALQADATNAALSAARAARNDADAETINGHVERFRSLRDDAAAIDIPDADAVASALGIE
jgi:hypothetical protein